jgi:enamine deaminase RidA (YjgF/YER057c/UK114 family)
VSTPDGAVQRITSGAPWEDKVAYRRAVRVGNQVFVAGTVSVGEGGGVHAPGDPGAQAARCLAIIVAALQEAGADVRHVVRTRMFVTDMSPSTQAAVGAAHHAVFKIYPPASSMIGVAALADPAYLVEIEADAIITDQE